MPSLSHFEVAAAGVFGNQIFVGHNDEHGMPHGTFHGEDSVLHAARRNFRGQGEPPALTTLFVVAHPMVGGKPSNGIITPCALCRGKLRNLHPDAEVISFNPHSGEFWRKQVSELLQHPQKGEKVGRPDAGIRSLARAATKEFAMSESQFDHQEGIAVKLADGRVVSSRNFESAAFTSSASAGQRLILNMEKDRIKRVYIRTSDPRGAHPYTLQAILDYNGGKTAEIFEETPEGIFRTTMDKKVENAFSRDDFAS